MTRRLFVAACCVLLAATSLFAQSRGATRDPVSGTWTGQLVPQNASDPISITMQLKFDRKSAVSGTFTGFPSPGDVKAGTFDPKTGALKLELGRQGESAVLLILEGTIAKGTATGRFTGERTGEFKLTKKA
jgi:hypothetical protein